MRPKQPATRIIDWPSSAGQPVRTLMIQAVDSRHASPSWSSVPRSSSQVALSVAHPWKWGIDCPGSLMSCVRQTMLAT